MRRPRTSWLSRPASSPLSILYLRCTPLRTHLPCNPFNFSLSILYLRCSRTPRPPSSSASYPPFNSLFEMPVCAVHTATICTCNHLSILYLRCLRKGLGPWLIKRVGVLSILYLRCLWFPWPCPSIFRRPTFNSLFEMPAIV